jgi:hypothetical protein
MSNSALRLGWAAPITPTISPAATLIEASRKIGDASRVLLLTQTSAINNDSIIQ